MEIPPNPETYHFGDQTLNEFQRKKFQTLNRIKDEEENRLQMLRKRRHEIQSQREELQQLHNSGNLEEYKARDLLNKFGSPGAGAPLRTDSGRVKTELSRDPEIRFHNAAHDMDTLEIKNRYVESDVRQDKLVKPAPVPNITKYAMNENELSMLNEQADQHKYHRARWNTNAPEPLLFSENRDFTNYSEHQVSKPSDSLSRTDRFSGESSYVPDDSRFHSTDNPEKDYKQPSVLPSEVRPEPFSKNPTDALPPVDARKKKPWYFAPPPNPEEDDSPHEISYMGYGINIGGSILRKRNNNPRHGFTLIKNEFGQNVVSELNESKDEFDPNDKGGAGAPRKAPDGSRITQIQGSMKEIERPSSGDPQSKRFQQHVYLSELRQGMQEQRERDRENLVYEKAPIGELASIMKKGQVGKPRRDPDTGLLTDQHLPSTDVTKSQVEVHSPAEYPDGMREYHDSLRQAAEEQYRYSELEKLRARQEAQMHAETFPNYFGRPGYGAPNPIKKRLDLFEHLNKMPSQKPVLQPLSPDKFEMSEDPRVLQGIRDSRHTNLYDFDQERLQPVVEEKVLRYSL